MSLTLLLLCLVPQSDRAIVDSFAGTGKKGFTGDGGPATKATLNQPFHCALDRKGNLYIAEAMNHCIRKVDLKTGRISTVAGTGKKGYTGDGGPAVQATFNEPYAVVVDDENSLYIVDRLNAVVRKVDGRTGIITTLAGSGKKGFSGDGGPANRAKMVEPNDCCLDGKGGLLIADVSDWRVRRVDLKTGIISTFAGSGRRKGRLKRSMLGDGGPATKATLYHARAVCVDGQGNTFICERRGNAIRRVDSKGMITTIAGTGGKGSKDGPGKIATFNGPKAIRCDSKGNIFVVDTEKHSIRKLAAEPRKVSTIHAGRLDRPHGCEIDSQGTIYIADSNHHRVQRVRFQKR